MYILVPASVYCSLVLKMITYVSFFVFLTVWVKVGKSNPDARRLIENLFVGYNKLIRPAINNSDVVQVKLKLRLSQLLDVHEKNQIMTTNVWLTQQWEDYNFKWMPEEYGGVQLLHVPASDIWVPDIVLYNNADGNYQVSIMTKAVVMSNGTIIWEPPAIYKSMCQMDVLWFPFDEQYCEMKFGSWTYDGNEVDLIHYDERKSTWVIKNDNNITLVEDGIDLSDFYPSAEWDIMEIPAERHESRFDCCAAPYIDLRFFIRLRRKTLFYTVNLIIPSVAISFLTVFVFYLPSDSGEKVVLCISILISLTVFFLLLVEIIPSTSLVIPLIGLYLLFTMVMVTLSIAVTVITLNVHYRSPNTNRMPPWVRIMFTLWLPWFLRIRRPVYNSPKASSKIVSTIPNIWDRRKTMSGRKKSMTNPVAPTANSVREMMMSVEAAQRERSELRKLSIVTRQKLSVAYMSMSQQKTLPNDIQEEQMIIDDRSIGGPQSIEAAIDGACFIADHLKQQAIDDEVREDWQYIAQVLDRLFLWIFTLSCFTGTCVIILRAPVIWDTRKPYDHMNLTSSM